MLNSINNTSVVLINEKRNGREIYREKHNPANAGTGVEVSIGEPSLEPATYTKPFAPAGKTDILSVIKQYEEFLEPLKLFVDRLVSQQADLLDKVPVKYTKELSKEEIEKAQELISEDGEFGVKKTAERIVQFAKAISGEDKSKIGELKEAIEQGFKEAEKVLGGLPEISKKTREEVMKRLDEWQQS